MLVSQSEAEGAGVREREQVRRVVVVGGSIAGLLAAAALAGPGRSVTVLERDALPVGPEPRPGVPQGRQPHVFLHRGLLAVEELLPGVDADLRAAGAVPLDTGYIAWLGESGWAPRGPQYEILSLTRPLFEHVVRDHVCRLAGVELRDGTAVTGLRRGSSTGPRWWVDTAGDPVPADLVIDASGRSSRLPPWLVALGVGPARTTRVDARVGYATARVAVPPGTVTVDGIELLQTPDRSGGSALPVEGDTWLVTAVGAGARRPGRDRASFVGTLASLPDPSLHDLAARAEAEVVIHRQTGNQRHHYDRVRGWPDGLLVVGDALCAFNPVYGQGVTVAALEALALRDAARGPLRTRRLLRRFGRVVDLPWRIATSEDLRYPTAGGRVPRASALFSAWTRELGRMGAHGDQLAQLSIARVYHVMASPWLLLHPALVARSVRARLRGYGDPTPRPQVFADERSP
ncbi:NAD(P)/FAD-dependent oxidoreductase [Cellulomonas sp. Root137]|uniref:NAD(P)/FAD-dependent oxidoreductase n=1 Tax=Cellulomonas sp. Root137 TaxID=1736459 RepID=UPI000A3DC760|nr:FAD-dependent monooxygenase [Cellulomonas sp. Root137]